MKMPVIVAITLLLTACSGGPSTSEAKQVILNRIGNGQGCSRLAIEDFEKVNAIAEGDSNYQVAVKYTLVVKPPFGIQMTQAQYDAQLDPRLYQPELRQLPANQLWTACQTVDPMIIGAVQQGEHQYGQQNPGKIALLNGFQVDMSETINMVKTDNGWQAGQ